ncbi:MAG: stage II sporulation protein M [Chloroflexi bacterium]|nr:MAG: stage II sporulation protein M [Chloroflexota bacterium]
MPRIASPGAVDRFVEDHLGRWSRLADLVSSAAGRVNRLKADEVLELGRLYRAVTGDLAIAQRDFPGDIVTIELNDLVAGAHALVYSEAPTSVRRLRRFIFVDIPGTIRANGRFVIASAILLFGPALVTFVAGLLSPEVAAGALPQALREEISRRRPGTELPEGLRLLEGPVIIVNNVRIAIVAFAGGLTAGLLTAYVLITNGAFLGTVFAVLQNAGLAWTLLTFVSAHGFLELSAIVLSGAAGLRFAWAILQPGERTRGSALRLAGTQAMRIIFLVIVVLGCAGLLEVYVSPTNAPAIVKVTVGLGTGTLLWAYALFGDRLLTLRRRQKKRFFSSI